MFEMKPNECPHDDFGADVEVNKIEDANTLSVDLSIRCQGCGARVVFLGMPGGLSFAEPRASPFGIEARPPAKLRHKDWACGQYDVGSSNDG